MSEIRGRCLCGAVTFAYQGPEKWRGFCHCESCRRQTSAPVAAFVGVPRARARIEGGALGVYESSPGVRRTFCRRCGSPIAYESERWADETHFYACALEHPEAAAPQFHVHAAERLPWLELADDLPRSQGTGD